MDLVVPVAVESITFQTDPSELLVVDFRRSHQAARSLIGQPAQSTEALLDPVEVCHLTSIR